MRLLERFLKDNAQSTLLGMLIQFIKFGLVGVSNTAISYGIEMLCYYVILVNSAMPQNAKVIVTSVIAFVVSVTNSYIWNNRFVFQSEGKKRLTDHVKAYLKTVICYGITGLILSPVLKMVLVGWNVPYWLASLGTLIITIPLNFVLNKFWAFKKKG